MTDFENELRSKLWAAVPIEQSTEGLAANAVARAANRRRARRVAVGAAAAAVVALVVTISQLTGPHDAGPAYPGPSPRADCSVQADVMSAVPTSRPVTAPRHAWLCPAGPGDQRATGADGWELPGTRLDTLAADVWIGPPGEDFRCVGHRRGPAFTLTVEATDGRLTTYASRDLTCDGLPTLATFLSAAADEEADREATHRADGRVGCRSLSELRRQQAVAPSWGDATQPFRQATFCLAPTWLRFDAVTHTSRFVDPVAPRAYAEIPLDEATLALLNADVATTRGGFRGNGECGGEGAWTYTIQGVTPAGTHRYLTTDCLDEFFRRDVSADGREGFIPSAATQAALRRLVPRD